MKKQILLAFFALLLPFAASSQVVLRYGPNIDAGFGSASVITPYVSFPNKFVKPYAGNRITKVNIGLNKAATNVTLYINYAPKNKRHVYTQKVGELQKGWNTVELTTPYELSDTSNVAIGYRATFSEAYGVGYSLEPFSDGDYIYNNSQTQWTSTYGSICIQAVVEGDNMPQNEMLIGSLSNQTAPFDSTTVTMQTTVRNVGGNAVESYTLEYTYDDKVENLEFNHALDINASDTVRLTVPSTEVGTHNLRLVVKEVNGQPDFYTANDTASCTLKVLNPNFRRRVVCEEGTGTWCGFCPRGMVGMELMKEKYPEYFIAISVHGGDELEIPDSLSYTYKPLLERFGGFPTCFVDRRRTGDPYNDILQFYNMESLDECHTRLNATGTWNADGTIHVTSTLVTDEDMQDMTYNMAYAVVEDSVTGYAQANYYAGGGNGYMYGWEEKSDPTTDFAYNDLARGIFPQYDGEPLELNSTIANETNTFSYDVPLPPTVVNKSKVHVVCLLINRSTGFIDNAANVWPTEADRISTISASDVRVVKSGNGFTVNFDGNATRRVSIYTISGQLVAQQDVAASGERIALPTQGNVYIVVVSGGGKPSRSFKLMF
ncbi:MAG: Omp28-related outer membrane protein [Prevotella sp.]|jgi:hypothetical protein